MLRYLGIKYRRQRTTDKAELPIKGRWTSKYPNTRGRRHTDIGRTKLRIKIDMFSNVGERDFRRCVLPAVEVSINIKKIANLLAQGDT